MLLYGLSLSCCTPRAGTDMRTHRRLLTAQLGRGELLPAVAARLHLRATRTATASGWMFFAALTSFDKPFNQAPSLHIALLVILWDLYAGRPGVWRDAMLHGWSLLIAVSVLTTYQHHFIDIPTGALLGWLCVWLWPLDASQPTARPARFTDEPKRWRLASFYVIGAAACFGPGDVHDRPAASRCGCAGPASRC
jgi:membrane-associated phospholipid phosphatase